VLNEIGGSKMVAIWQPVLDPQGRKEDRAVLLAFGLDEWSQSSRPVPKLVRVAPTTGLS